MWRHVESTIQGKRALRGRLGPRRLLASTMFWEATPTYISAATLPSLEFYGIRAPGQEEGCRPRSEALRRKNREQWRGSFS